MGTESARSGASDGIKARSSDLVDMLETGGFGVAMEAVEEQGDANDPDGNARGHGNDCGALETGVRARLLGRLRGRGWRCSWCCRWIGFV